VLVDSKAFLPYICFMPTLTVTSKGQVTFRKDLLQHLGVEPGERIAVEKLPDGRIEVRAERQSGDISEIFDLLKSKTNIHLTIEEMKQVIEDGWAGKT
jgi:bifunctional DNA-binding transcriptional regulator/antitoxin component of YhaV-PrlF toxin-antitoxin module